MHPSEIPLNVLAEAAADGVILIDDQSTILFVNPAAGRIFGYEPVDILGNKLTSLMPERLRRGIGLQVRARPWHGSQCLLSGAVPAGRSGAKAVKTTRVLLADDHVLVRAGIRSLLEKMTGIEVVAEAGDGREVLE